MRHTNGIAAIAAGLALAWLPPALAADSCLDQVQGLARQYYVSVEPPAAATPEQPKPAIDSKDLARSGGVIKPPETPGAKVIQPPQGVDSNMETLPKVPDKQAGAPDAPKTDPLSAADRAALQSVLMSARDEADKGREQACLERVQEARRLVEVPRKDS